MREQAIKRPKPVDHHDARADAVVCGFQQTIAKGLYPITALSDLLESSVAHDRAHDTRTADTLLDKVFRISGHPISELPERESQPYVPLPARQILDLIAVSGITAGDTFYDLGSGLGRVVMTMRALTGAACFGVERQSALVGDCTKTIQSLSMSGVSILEEDIRSVSYDNATIVFAYAPCFGRMWAQTAQTLSTRAASGPLTVVTFGPCEPVLKDSPRFKFREEKGFQIYSTE